MPSGAPRVPFGSRSWPRGYENGSSQPPSLPGESNEDSSWPHPDSLELALFFADIQLMFEWKTEYSVSIASIDAQHQRLFATADELHEAMRNGQARPVLAKILDRLVQYTKTHFATEEGLMKIHGYPDLATHAKEHEALTKQVLDFQRAFQAGDAFVSIELMTFLKDWLEKHIKGTDMLYSPFLIQRRVA